MVPKPQKPKIVCARDVQNRLAKHGSKGDSFENIIVKLLDFYESKKK